MTTRRYVSAGTTLAIAGIVGGCGAAFSAEDLAEFDNLFTVSGVVAGGVEDISPSESIHVALAWREPNGGDFWVAGDTVVFSDGNKLRFSLGLPRLPPSSLRRPGAKLNVKLPAGSEVSVGRLVVYAGTQTLERGTKLIVGTANRLLGVSVDLAALYVEGGYPAAAGELPPGFHVVRFSKACPDPSLCTGGVQVPTRMRKFGRREAADVELGIDPALSSSGCVSQSLDSELHCVVHRAFLRQQDGAMYSYQHGQVYKELEKDGCCPLAQHPKWGCNPGHVRCPQGLVCCSDLTCQKTCKEKWVSTWKLIPAGKFTMGSPPDDPCRKDDELAHEVVLTRPFYMATHEVTQAEFKLVMGYNPSCYTKDVWDPTIHCGSDFDCGQDCPVESVTWSEAAEYCNKLSASNGLLPCYFCSDDGTECHRVLYYLGQYIYTCEGYRLPTEAEWEYGYRGGTNTSTYKGGLSSCDSSDPLLDPIAWYMNNSGDTPHAIGQKKSNPFGLYDMAGNVREWTHDPYHDYPTSVSTVVDPSPTNGVPFVVRGGGFRSKPRAIRASERDHLSASWRVPSVGFRCVRVVQ